PQPPAATPPEVRPGGPPPSPVTLPSASSPAIPRRMQQPLIPLLAPGPLSSLKRREALRTSALALASAAMATCQNLDNFAIEVAAKATVPAGTVIDQLLGIL